MSEQRHVVILAAGKGTRMRSKKQKVFHELAGRTLLEHTLETARRCQAESISVVLSPDQNETKEFLKEAYPDIQIAFQNEQKGTGDAVLAAQEYLEDLSGTVLILFADTPLIRPETLWDLAGHRERTKSAVTILALDAPGHPGYGRLVKDDQGGVVRIVEMKDATTEEKEISLCNSGLMACRADSLLLLLKKITPQNQAEEYYLTDIVALAHQNEDMVTFLTVDDGDEVMGINTRKDLADAESIMQKRLRNKAMEAGVTFLDSSTVYLSYDTMFDQDVTVHPHVFFGPGVELKEDVTVYSFSHLEGACVKAGAQVGPYARLRPGTVLEEESRVGNFVELKKTTLGRGSKANHLSYLGDASIGEKCNIGAGTITCNYNGYQKQKTILDDEVFVGSNSILIAPVTVHKGAYVAAGTTVTKEVKADALALSRTPQTEREGGAEKLRQRFRSLKSR